MSEPPSSAIPPRAILYLFILFFVVPGICCVGCIGAAQLYKTPAERLPVADDGAKSPAIPPADQNPTK